jgi:hypothetical protein
MIMPLECMFSRRDMRMNDLNIAAQLKLPNAQLRVGFAICDIWFYCE